MSYLRVEMSIEKHIDQMIREAMAHGEFDDLKGKGKPLNLVDYFATPEDVRMGYSVLKSNEFVPEEVDPLKEIAGLKEEIAACPDETVRIELKKQLRNQELALSLNLERNRRKR